jgi:hypothetical protein
MNPFSLMLFLCENGVWYIRIFLFGIFIKKHCKSMLISTATSLSLHAATWKPLNGISWNFIFKSFTKICQDTPVFIQIRLQRHSLHMYIYM